MILIISIISSVIFYLVQAGRHDIQPDPVELTLQVGHSKSIQFTITQQITYPIRLYFNETDYLGVPPYLEIKPGTRKGSINVTGLAIVNLAFLEVANCTSMDPKYNSCLLNISDAFVRIQVIESYVIEYLVFIVGWAYFFAWSISFYPQIFLNAKRKSVIGLNFDFLCLNVIGFSAYTLYNCLMYFSTRIQDAYEVENPRSPIPVLLNDVVFACHALAASIFTVFQCFIYERENQRVSLGCGFLSSSLLLFGFGASALALLRTITVLEFITSLSMIKMIVTMCKYFPQAYFNYRRKSTVGWSIGNVLLDFTGGTLDILQMILQASNVNNWSAFYGNPVKFGLGLVSIIFDVFFMLQHYVLYRGATVPHNEYAGFDNPESEESSENPVENYGSIPAEEPIVQPEEERMT
ncbi:hypothetical protein WR25_00671 isoform A [Diploscapter pachys]|uniref:Cystinosin n=1 Tax=Diploscapter pachys TaxID=2018661 RepID=A0A2A2JJ05_9BILA|nr:hypothetical protein WR25_00671 isoform A [Diploscapter pachys]